MRHGVEGRQVVLLYIYHLYVLCTDGMVVLVSLVCCTGHASNAAITTLLVLSLAASSLELVLWDIIAALC